jgi:S1-C subfamily serine protease
VRRPAARRPRLLATAVLTATLGACVDDGAGPAPEPRVVAVAALPCDRPLPSEGVGVVLGDGLVVTAAHVVEGPRRDVTADGVTAAVVAVDRRSDLALLRADVAGRAVLADDPAGALRVATPAGAADVTFVRHGPLVVHDATDRATYRRDVHTVRPAVPAGDSGAPLVDVAGHVVGIVVLANRRDDTTYAVTAAEVRTLLEADRDADVVCPD